MFSLSDSHILLYLRIISEFSQDADLSIGRVHPIAELTGGAHLRNHHSSLWATSLHSVFLAPKWPTFLLPERRTRAGNPGCRRCVVPCTHLG